MDWRSISSEAGELIAEGIEIMQLHARATKHTRMMTAGIDARVHFTMNTTIDENRILMSVTTTLLVSSSKASPTVKLK